jgi:hypothetical protein
MTKYTQYSRRPPVRERPWKIHPIWRGIGCILILIIPVMSYAGSALLVQYDLQQAWFPIPKELAQPVNLPFVGNVPYLFANLIVTLVLMLVGYGVLTSFYALIYRIVGPPSLGPLDAPPLRRTHRGRR